MTVLALLLAVVLQSISAMIKSYLKITLRNIIKNKWYSLINVIGLTIGISGALVIYLHLSNEFQFDDFHHDVDRLYRVTRATDTPTGLDYEPNVPYPLINSLRTDFSAFEEVTLFHREQQPTIAIKDEKFKFKEAIFADSTFFDVFSFKVLSGNAKKFLGQPNYTFLSEGTAKQLFGNEQPVGQKVRLNNLIDLEVAGIYEDIPANSSIQADFIVSYPSFSKDFLAGIQIDRWGISAEGFAYVKLKPSVAASDAESQFKEALKKYYSDEDYARRHYYLQPILEIHFDQKWNARAANTTGLYVLAIIGIFLILIGCVNFINLSTALAVKKSKEIGVRKTLGAGKLHLIFQFLGETFAITLISVLLSVALIERILPLFNQYFGTALTFNLLHRPELGLFLVFVIVLVTLIAGMYPALILAGYNPVKALKNNIHSQSSSSLFLRKGLITLQFVISQVLIICTIIISQQMDYFFSKPMGFDKDGVINISLGDNETSLMDQFKGRIKQITGVQQVSLSSSPPASDDTFETGYKLNSSADETRYNIQFKLADNDYMATYNLNLLHGRWFTDAEAEIMSKNKFEAGELEIRFFFVLNETAAKTLGFNNPVEIIGQEIVTGMGDIAGPVVGVVEDFHTGSLHDKIVPCAIIGLPRFYFTAGVKTTFAQSKQVIEQLEQEFNALFPDQLFEYSFLDDKMKEFYEAEQQSFDLLKLFSALSIIISCLGLLGMISFIATQRTKEVGVRKVLGASVSNIVSLLTKDFILLVVIAFVFAAPISYYFMQNWLDNFAYKISIQLWFFIAAISISAMITLITIGFQALQSALSNPVDSLRDE